MDLRMAISAASASASVRVRARPHRLYGHRAIGSIGTCKVYRSKCSPPDFTFDVISGKLNHLLFIIGKASALSMTEK
jgi:hypothetical protein